MKAPVALTWTITVTQTIGITIPSSNPPVSTVKVARLASGVSIWSKSVSVPGRVLTGISYSRSLAISRRTRHKAVTSRLW